MLNDFRTREHTKDVLSNEEFTLAQLGYAMREESNMLELLERSRRHFFKNKYPLVSKILNIYIYIY